MKKKYERLSVEKPLSEDEKKKLLIKYRDFYFADKNAGAVKNIDAWIEQKVKEAHWKISEKELKSVILAECGRLADVARAVNKKETAQGLGSGVKENPTQSYEAGIGKFAHESEKSARKDQKDFTDWLATSLRQEHISQVDLAAALNTRPEYITNLKNPDYFGKCPDKVYVELVKAKCSGKSLRKYFEGKLIEVEKPEKAPKKKQAAQVLNNGTQDEGKVPPQGKVSKIKEKRSKKQKEDNPIIVLSDERIKRLEEAIITAGLTRSKAAEYLGIKPPYLTMLLDPKPKQWNIPDYVWGRIEHWEESGLGLSEYYKQNYSSIESAAEPDKPIQEPEKETISPAQENENGKSMTADPHIKNEDRNLFESEEFKKAFDERLNSSEFVAEVKKIHVSLDVLLKGLMKFGKEAGEVIGKVADFMSKSEVSEAIPGESGTTDASDYNSVTVSPEEERIQRFRKFYAAKYGHEQLEERDKVNEKGWEQIRLQNYATDFNEFERVFSNLKQFHNLDVNRWEVFILGELPSKTIFIFKEQHPDIPLTEKMKTTIENMGGTPGYGKRKKEKGRRKKAVLL
jgi:hypothetical protein